MLNHKVKFLIPTIEHDINGIIINFENRHNKFLQVRERIAWCEEKWGEPTPEGRWTFYHDYASDTKLSGWTLYFKNEDDKVLFQLTWG